MELDKDLQESDWSGELSEEQLTYAALDVAYLHKIRLELRRQLELAKLWKVYELERDLAPCIGRWGRTASPWTWRRSSPCKSAPSPRPGNGKRSACA